MKLLKPFCLIALTALMATSAMAQSQPAVGSAAPSIVIEKQGTGKNPTATSSVTVHYKGTLANGTVFDSSYDRNQPISFPLNGVIPCWQQLIPQIKEGGKAVLTCPAASAYGSRAIGKIPPNSTLTFVVELLKVN